MKKKPSAVLLRFIVNFFPLWYPNSISANKRKTYKKVKEGKAGNCGSNKINKSDQNCDLRQGVKM